MDLKKNILRVFSANFLSLVSGILISFIVPAVLSIEAYSNVKTYTFYTTFIGFLHFGFIDGMYIKYGGKNKNDIDKNEIKSEHDFFMIFQILISFIIIIYSILNKNIIVFLMGVSVIPINFLSFHSLFYQSTGQFEKYTKISYSYTIIYFVLNIFLAIILKSQNYILYCLITLLSNLIVFLLLEIQFYKEVKGGEGKFSKKILNNIKVGFFVMLGNLSVLLFYAIDRIFIKIFFSTNDFAYYSFSISMLNIINVVVNSVSMTFFNYLSKGENKEEIKKIKNYLLILGGLSSVGYFVFAAVVNIFLKKYVPALNIIAISFAAYPYIIIVNALYVNLYKARKDEKKYFMSVFLMVFISLIYNLLAIVIFKSPEFIAAATTISFITWYGYSMKDFKYLRITLKEFLYLTIILISFLILSNNFTWFYGSIYYILIFISTTIICFKNELKEILGYFKIRKKDNSN